MLGWSRCSRFLVLKTNVLMLKTNVLGGGTETASENTSKWQLSPEAATLASAHLQETSSLHFVTQSLPVPTLH